MKFHIICEGPQDQEILEKIVCIILKHQPEFIAPSNTQTKNRGIQSILIKKRFFQFLHYSFQNRVDFIIICVDNDEDYIINKIPERYSLLNKNYDEFQRKYQSYNHKPTQFLIIPIQTIDYWILAGKMKKSGPGTLKGIESMPKVGMKERVWGKDNLAPNGLVFPEPFKEILDSTITEDTLENVFIHLTSFLPLYTNLKKIK